MRSLWEKFFGSSLEKSKKPSQAELAHKMARLRCSEVDRHERSVSAHYFANEPSDHAFLRENIDAAFAELDILCSAIVINENSQETSYQFALIASYLRTHCVISRQIERGNHIEAMILIRKQIELLARFRELDSKKFYELEGKTPSISVLNIDQVGRVYGYLSEVAHFSKIYVAEHMGTSSASGAASERSIHVFSTYQESSHRLFQDYCTVCIYFISATTCALDKWDSSLNKNLFNALGTKALLKAREMGVFT